MYCTVVLVVVIVMCSLCCAVSCPIMCLMTFGCYICFWTITHVQLHGTMYLVMFWLRTVDGRCFGGAALPLHGHSGGLGEGVIPLLTIGCCQHCPLHTQSFPDCDIGRDRGIVTQGSAWPSAAHRGCAAFPTSLPGMLPVRSALESNLVCLRGRCGAGLCLPGGGGGGADRGGGGLA